MAVSKEVYYARLGEDKNILVIDPNRVIVDDITLGEKRVEDRYVPQEDLIMYAGLKAYSKGKSSVFDDTTEPTIIDFGEIKVNFLNPLKDKDNYKNFFTTQWTDVFTDQRSADAILDPETFGIKSIEITQNASLVPRITIEFIDVRGKTLMERGDDDENPYNLFYSLPYPTFMLTIKGYYGKAITYPLVLLKTNTRFDPASGDYYVRCEFLSRTFAIFNDFLLIYGMVAPFMFEVDVNGISTYQGMEILRHLYLSQNEKIIADAVKEGKKATDADVKMRLIERPITIYDLVKAAEDIYVDDLINFNDAVVKEKYDARGAIDEAKAMFDIAYDYLMTYFAPGSDSADLKFDNGYYVFREAGKRLKNSVELTSTINDINEVYQKYIGRSDNATIRTMDQLIKKELGNKGLVLREGKIINIETIETNVAGVGYVLTLTNVDKIFAVISNVFSEQYKQTSEVVLSKQREIIKEKIGFDITMENVVRIMLNNMQTFLMLVNLTTKKSFLQIKNQETRRESQKINSEYIKQNSKDKMFPWPNFYVKDRAQEDTYRRTYPGIKTSNRVWPEVAFVEEIYKSLDRIKNLDRGVADDQLKETTLMSGFLNISALEQYGKISKIETTIEILKKIGITLLHNGIQFKELEENAIDKVADGLVAYDYSSLVTKVKALPSSKMVFDLQYIIDNFLVGTNLYENLLSKLGSQISDVNKLALVIKEENDAFLTRDQNKMKVAKGKFYNTKGKPNWLSDVNSYTTQIFMALMEEKDPLAYTNPGTQFMAQRTPAINIIVAPNNNNYTSLPFAGYEKVDGKHPLVGKKIGLNLIYGYHNARPDKPIYDYSVVEDKDTNNKANGARALAINNIINTEEDGAPFQFQYNKY